MPFVNEALGNIALVVEKQEAKAYSKKIDEIIENDELRADLAEKIHNTVVRLYSWKSLTKKLISDMKTQKII